MPKASPMRVTVVLLSCLLLLTGCARIADHEQARTCRSLLSALTASRPATAVVAIREDDDKAGVTIAYRATALHRKEPPQILHCRFDDAQNLIGVDNNGNPLSVSALFFLKRFWLDAPDSAAADEFAGIELGPEISFGFAYFLQQLLNALPLSAIYALLAAAYSLIYGLVGRINLAFGEFATLGGAASLLAILFAANQSPIVILPAAMVMAIVVSMLHGYIVGRLIFLPLARAPGQQVLVATIGLAIFLQEYLRIAQGSRLQIMAPMLDQAIAVAHGPGFMVTATPMTLLVAGFAMLIAGTLLVGMKFSGFGRDWRAYSDDPLAAELFGISPRAIFSRSFALACALAGLTGALIIFTYGSLGYGASTLLGLKALIAAILGGIGSVPGALLGGIAIGLTEAIWSAYFPIVYRDLALFTLLVAMLMFRPGGFMGQADVAERRGR